MSPATRTNIAVSTRDSFHCHVNWLLFELFFLLRHQVNSWCKLSASTRNVIKLKNRRIAHSIFKDWQIWNMEVAIDKSKRIKTQTSNTQNVLDPFAWIISHIYLFVCILKWLTFMAFISSFMFYSSLLTLAAFTEIPSSDCTSVTPHKNHIFAEELRNQCKYKSNPSHFSIVYFLWFLNCGGSFFSPSNEQKTQIKSTSICIFILLFLFKVRLTSHLLADSKQFFFSSIFFHSSNSIKFYILPAMPRFFLFSS